MPEIIGVHHSGLNVLDAVVNYIDWKHPNLESIMLELHPSQKGLLDCDWFGTLADYYTAKGAKVIYEDTYRFEAIGTSAEEAEEHPLRYALLQTPRVLQALISGKLYSVRDKGFIQNYEAEKPEVTVIGNSHAFALCTYTGNPMISISQNKLYCRLKARKLKPEHSIFVPLYDERELGAYTRGAINTVAGIGVITAAHYFDAGLANTLGAIGVAMVALNLDNTCQYIHHLAKKTF